MYAGRISIGHDMSVVRRHVDGSKHRAIDLGITYREAAYCYIRIRGEVERVTA